VPRSCSPLELLLPTGRTNNALVLGDDCPPVLAPSRAEVDVSGGTVDLVILAPSGTQRRDSRWVRQAAETTASRISQDGIAYVVPGSAIQLRRALAGEGLRSAETVLHIPDVGRTRYLVPVGTSAESYALEGGIPMSPYKRRLASGLGTHGRAIFGPTGVIHRRDPQAPLADWLFRLDAREEPVSTIIAVPAARTGKLIVYRFAGERREPDAIVKLGTGAGNELRALRRIGPGAGEAGARVPVALASGRLDSMPFVLESIVTGRAAVDLVVRGRIRPQEVQSQIALWLERWNRSCARPRPIVRNDVERFLLAPASRASLAGPYLEFLQALGARAVGRSCSFVPSHGDLTLANVLVDPQDGLGIVDWECATDNSLPLTDLLYAGADAVAARRRYADRLAAFEACFVSSGEHFSALESLRQRLATTLGLDPVVQALCFHACWLHHAANEASRQPDSSRRPFVTILERIATAPETFGVHQPTR